MEIEFHLRRLIMRKPINWPNIMAKLRRLGVTYEMLIGYLNERGFSSSMGTMNRISSGESTPRHDVGQAILDRLDAAEKEDQGAAA